MGIGHAVGWRATHRCEILGRWWPRSCWRHESLASVVALAAATGELDGSGVHLMRLA